MIGYRNFWMSSSASRSTRLGVRLVFKCLNSWILCRCLLFGDKYGLSTYISTGLIAFPIFYFMLEGRILSGLDSDMVSDSEDSSTPRSIPDLSCSLNLSLNEVLTEWNYFSTSFTSSFYFMVYCFYRDIRGRVSFNGSLNGLPYLDF